MPRRSAYKKKSHTRRPMRRYKRRASYRKRGNNGRPSDKVIYRGIGMPDQFFTKLKYTESFTLAAGVGAPYKQYQMRGNSLYDPDYTGVGSQPMYFDQLATLYSQYLVYGSSVRIRCNATGDSFAIGNVDIALTPLQNPVSSTSWTSIDDQLSNKLTKRQSTVRYDNAGSRILRHSAKTAQIFDSGYLKSNLPIFAATTSANPTAAWYWVIGQQGMDRTSTTSSVNYQVEITYYVRFFNLQEPALS